MVKRLSEIFLEQAHKYSKEILSRQEEIKVLEERVRWNKESYELALEIENSRLENGLTLTTKRDKMEISDMFHALSNLTKKKQNKIK